MKIMTIGLIAVVVLAAVGGGAFWAGTKVGENRVTQDQARFLRQQARGQGGQFPSPLQTPQPGQGGVQGLGSGVMGTIEEVQGNTLSVSTAEGTIRVQTTDTTLIEKYLSVNVGDLKVGEQVVVSGSRNDDGSLTARSIQSLRALPSAPAGQ
jgi:hypothetical protein